MNAVELLHFSLENSFDVLKQVVSDLTQEQADWMPPGKTSPISSLYWHIVAYADQVVHEICMPPFQDISYNEWLEARLAKQDLGMGQTPLRQRAGWQEKVVLSLPPEDPEDPFWDVRIMREGLRVDLQALNEYAREVAQTLLNWVDTLSREDLERLIFTPTGDYKLGHFLDFFIIWNNNVHCGEISAVKGLQGLKGYPW